MTKSPERTAADAWIAGLESGDPHALDQMFALLYQDLRGIAASYLRNERADHTLQPTALVHEAYVRLMSGAGPGPPRGRGQFLALAARAMRRVLVDHARARTRDKRGGGELLRVTLGPEEGPAGRGESLAVEILDIDAALARLAALDARQAEVVEMRAFSGLTLAEIGGVLGLSTTTVHDEWEMGRTWLWRELRKARSG